MKNMIFATVNGHDILGSDILRTRKRLIAENENSESFVLKQNDDNNAFLNAESLEKLIDIHALAALAKFEGISVSDDEVSHTLVEVRSSFSDEAEWDSLLKDFGLDTKSIRKHFYLDMLIDMLIQSYVDHLEIPDENAAQTYYKNHFESMKTPSSYTFLELAVSSPDQIKLAATILSQKDTASISKEAEKYNISFQLNEDIPKNQLPIALQNMLEDLELYKIGTLPLEDGSIVMVKLLCKITGKVLTLEEAMPGLQEYLRIQQYKNTLDQLTEDALSKCQVIYHNTELLKVLS